MESTPFHVEYRWKKITKMGEISAKTYSMWNRGGRVKTSLVGTQNCAQIYFIQTVEMLY